MSYSFLINHFNLEFTHFLFHLSFFFVGELHNTYSVIYKRFSDIYSFVICLHMSHFDNGQLTLIWLAHITLNY